MTHARMRCMAWSPLGGGQLLSATGALGDVMDRIAAEHGVDRGAVAVAWLLAHPAGILPVMGTNSLPRIRALSDALKVRLTREDWFDLYSAAEGRKVP
jgi:predicted oxidoreductase